MLVLAEIQDQTVGWWRELTGSVRWKNTGTGGVLNAMRHTMTTALGAGLAIAAIALFGLGLLGMAVSNLRLAGFAFFTASLVIYVRETRTSTE